MPCKEDHEEPEDESRFKFTPRKALSEFKVKRAERRRIQEKERTVKVFAERERRAGEEQRLKSQISDVREEQKIQRLRSKLKKREAKVKVKHPVGRSRRVGTYLGKIFSGGIKASMKATKKHPKGKRKARKRRVTRRTRRKRRRRR